MVSSTWSEQHSYIVPVAGSNPVPFIRFIKVGGLIWFVTLP